MQNKHWLINNTTREINDSSIKQKDGKRGVISKLYKEEPRFHSTVLAMRNVSIGILGD